MFDWVFVNDPFPLISFYQRNIKSIMIVNLRAFKKKVLVNRKSMRSFLTRLENKPPKALHKMADYADKEVWQEIDCLTCGHCCKTMTPTFSPKDIKRIAEYLNLTPLAFKEKWLVFVIKDNDWQNKKQPCQFFNLKDKKCTIYPVRPADCAGFPHLTKKKVTDYLHVHRQNIQHCPATYKWVEKMQIIVKNGFITNTHLQ